MDPDANLKEQRVIVVRLIGSDSGDGREFADAERLAELVRALDEWMSRGGFPPRAWAHR